METYLVGGAVRDELLELPITDRDWVVVGAQAEDLLNAGYRAVGKDFPVFLHPDTHEEHALARTERKTAPGYHGFAFDTAKTVTLEQDLARRDLTINAMARTSSGQLVDPFHGQLDITRRLLRHVSAAFVEDPVRVLRVAKFMARLAPLGFTVAAETLELMRTMVGNGEVDQLVAERVWQEFESALRATAPRAFIETLRECQALAIILPEVERLFGVPQPAEWHPEIDTGLHTMMVLDQATRLSPLAEVRFAALCHDLGKGVTATELLPAHHGHELAGVPIVTTICERLRAPRRFRELAQLCTRYHLHCHRVFELTPKKLLKLLLALDVLRKPERTEQFLLVCEADARGRGEAADRQYPEADFLRGAAAALKRVNAAAIAQNTSKPADIQAAIQTARLNAIKAYRYRHIAD